MEFGAYVFGTVSVVLVAAVGVLRGYERRVDLAKVMEFQLTRSAETIRDKLIS